LSRALPIVDVVRLCRSAVRFLGQTSFVRLIGSFKRSSRAKSRKDEIATTARLLEEINTQKWTETIKGVIFPLTDHQSEGVSIGFEGAAHCFKLAPDQGVGDARNNYRRCIAD
jgi:hypothetical protein